jgi:hypothetical protein
MGKNKSSPEKHVGLPPLKTDPVNQLLFYSLIGIMVIIPLVVRVSAVNNFSPIFYTELSTSVKYDIFSYVKLHWLIVGTVITLSIYLFGFWQKKFRVQPDPVLAPLSLLYFLVLLSSALADYKTISFLGFYAQHTGASTVLSLLILFFISSQLDYSKNKLKVFLLCLSPFVLINFIASLLNFYDINVFNWRWVNLLIIPQSFPGGKLSASSRLITTLANPNFLSGVGAAFTGLFLTLAMLENNRKLRISYLICSVFCFAMVIASLSSSGFVTILALLPLMVLVGARSAAALRALKTLVIGIILCSLVYGLLSSHNQAVWPNTFGVFKQLALAAPSQETDTQLAFTTVAAGNQAISDHSENSEFKLPPKGWGPGTGRLYIWERTWQLIQSHPIFGYGLDTLPYYFPQDDPEKISALNDENTIVDKPHNMYLALGYGSGLPALASFLALSLIFSWRVVIVLRQSVDGFGRSLLAAMFIAWCGFMIQGLFNDLVMGANVLYWLSFGFSVSLVRSAYGDREAKL